MSDHMPNRHGYRGYVTSRPFMGERAPQHIQNVVIRDYAKNRELTYLLSATEYAMTGSQMILDQVIAELSSLKGIICYSLFQLPKSTSRRMAVYAAVLTAGGELHAAVEDLAVRKQQDIQRIEDIWLTRLTLPSCPGALEIRP